MAVSHLNKTTIPGNSRFIDVNLDKKSLPPRPGMGKGMKRSFVPTLTYDTGGSKVLVRGFDFDTTDEQLWAHMGSVGTVVAVHFVTKGSANVDYSSASQANF